MESCLTCEQICRLAERVGHTTDKLLGRNRANNASAVLLWRRFQFAILQEFFDHVFNDATSLGDVGNLATTKHDRDLHSVFMTEKLACLLDLEIDVVLTRLGPQPDFLGLGVVRMAFGLLFVLLVFEFAEVHDAANGRLLQRCHLDQIKPVFASNTQRFFGWNYA